MKLSVKLFRAIVTVGLIYTVLFFLLPSNSLAAGREKVITSYSELKSAVQSAQEGDTIYVDDIDFTAPGNVANSWMRIKIEKSLTIKAISKDMNAVFKNGAFILSGAKNSEGGITVALENIDFDGAVDTNSLTFSDFDWPVDEASGEYILDEAVLSQYAISCEGNVDASFANCSFSNYMNEYGPVMSIHYDDYTTIPFLLEMFGDYSGCTLKLSFDHCEFTDNAACYDGGAIYIEGNNNISFTADSCVFSNNKSGGGDFCMGGGAIYAKGAKLLLDNCLIKDNTANYLYPGCNSPEMDAIKGGGLYIDNAKLTLINSSVIGNKASVGGGIALTNSEADIDGCVFSKNRAYTDVESPYGDKGPWTNMGLGGAIYHEGMNGARTVIVNTDIVENSAKTAYGGIYTYYAGFEDMDVNYLDLKLCTYADNTSDSTYDYSATDLIAWCSHPGDIWTIPHLTVQGCFVTDDSFAADFIRYELPSEDNNYNFFATKEKANEKGITYGKSKDSERIVLNLPKGTDYKISKEYAEKLTDGHYDIIVRNIHIGNNYKKSLYDGQKHPLNLILLAIIAGCIAFAAVVVFVVLYHKKEREKRRTLEKADESEKRFVKAWLTKEEIDEALNGFPRVQTLTGRELEVLREILEGKKQKEVAYDLGIEITTVKDYYRRIYDKLDLANKEDLFRKFSELVAK